jgi:hypothetical protein
MKHRKPKYEKTTLRMAPGHGWRAQPGHKIIVIGRGAVRLEYPERWHVLPADDCIKIHDKKPPKDDCVLAVSYHYWPPEGRELTVASLVASAFRDDERSFFTISPVVEENRIDFVLAWAEGRCIDAREKREACARLCLARKDEIQALVTFDFWLDDFARCDPLWHNFLASLQLAEWVADPRKGPVLQ